MAELSGVERFEQRLAAETARAEAEAEERRKQGIYLLPRKGGGTIEFRVVNYAKDAVT